MKKRIVLSITLILLSITAFAQIDTIKDREVGLVFSSLNSFGLCYKTGNENTLFRITALTSTGTNSGSNYSQFSEGGNTDAVPSGSTNTVNAGLNFGVEKRKNLSEKFYFYCGLVLINSYTNSNSNTTTPATYTNGYFIHNVYYGQSAIVNNTTQSNTWTFNSGLGIVAGVAYKISNSFSIGAELVPSATYSYTDAKTSANTYTVSWLLNVNAPSTLEEYDISGVNQKITKGISYSIVNTNAAITIAYRIK